MTLLAVADEEAKALYDFYRPEMLEGVDLIIACGDLKREYLEFLVTMAKCPLYYVPGNHDDAFETEPPEGCECIDGRLVVFQSLRILGLGGSHRYRNGRHMYTESQMRHRIIRLMPKILLNRGFDILVTHAPARRINDLEGLSHRGFECFVRLIDRFKPKLFLHGHVHRSYGHNIPQKTRRDETLIVNAFQYCRIELP